MPLCLTIRMSTDSVPSLANNTNRLFINIMWQIVDIKLRKEVAQERYPVVYFIVRLSDPYFLSLIVSGQILPVLYVYDSS